ncbi:MAG: 5'(3')-deoxyribonucleotidase [Chitinophagaceae bacterium]|nr:5'(3')-deoxyribonucleotidase [Chitinophagaceae bacterium]
MNKQRVLVDMDEVIADPMGAMIGWYNGKYNAAIDFELALGGSWIRIFPEEHREMILERLLSPGFFRHLPVMKNSVDVLREINKRYELYIVSAAMEFPNSLKDKLEWLLENFPFLTWRQLILCGDKGPVQGDFMIDDHVKNLQHFNGKKYLFTSAHNLDITGYDRLNNWEEVADVFLNDNTTTVK